MLFCCVCFCAYTCTAVQVEKLASESHIYMLKNGRISLCGLNMENIDYVADAIKGAIITYPED